MIRRKEDCETQTRDSMRGGRGTVRFQHLWQPEELKGRTRLFARLTVPPGASIGFHEHVEEEEIFVVLSGHGRVRDGERDDIVKPGDTILTGGGAGHAIETLGTDPLELMAVILKY